jgi:hypothetical protein
MKLLEQATRKDRDRRVTFNFDSPTVDNMAKRVKVTATYHADYKRYEARVMGPIDVEFKTGCVIESYALYDVPNATIFRVNVTRYGAKSFEQFIAALHDVVDNLVDDSQAYGGHILRSARALLPVTA